MHVSRYFPDVLAVGDAIKNEISLQAMAPKPFSTPQDVEVRSQPTISPRKINQVHAQICYGKAAKAELEQDWNKAFHLYVTAAEGFLHFSRLNPDSTSLRDRCNKALSRAERIKAHKGDITPVAINRFSERE